MLVLFLDDSATRHEYFERETLSSDKNAKIIHAYTSDEAINYLVEASQLDLLSLDYDLSGSSGFFDPMHTGYEVAQFVLTMPNDKIPKKIIIHSTHEGGAEKLMRCLVGVSELEYVPSIY